MKRVVVGTNPVRELLRARPRDVALLLVQGDLEKGPQRELVGLARAAKLTVEPSEPEALDALCPRGVKHQGVVAICGDDYPYVDLDEVLREARTPPLLVALDEVTDVHNFGAITRSAVAFGADGVVTLRDRAAPVTPAVVRASAGATEHARIARVTNLARTLEGLADAGFACVGLAMEGADELHALDLRGPVCLVVGSEGRGLRRLTRERCTALGRIAMPGGLQSLNASVAAAIALYEVRRQRDAVAPSDEASFDAGRDEEE